MSTLLTDSPDPVVDAEGDTVERRVRESRIGSRAEAKINVLSEGSVSERVVLHHESKVMERLALQSDGEKWMAEA